MHFVETRQPITFNLPIALGAKPLRLETGKVNPINAEVWDHLLKQHDSEGASPLERYLISGLVKDVTADRANAVQGGAVQSIVAEVKDAPLQAAAVTFAKASSDKSIEDTSERDAKARLEALRAGERAKREIDPAAPPAKKKRREHGQAYDVEEVDPLPGER